MSYLFGVLNSATDIWSGAIDVCAVKRKDGSILCTPFYIRFGRLKVLDSGEKTIRIMVNEKLTDMCMKIGSNGIAYFVHESDDPIPDEQRVTSPVITGQISPGNSKDLFDSMAHVKERPKKSKSPSPVKKPEEIIFTFDDLIGNNDDLKKENQEFDSPEMDGEVSNVDETIADEENPNPPELYTSDDESLQLAEKAKLPLEVNTTLAAPPKSFFSWLFGSGSKNKPLAREASSTLSSKTTTLPPQKSKTPSPPTPVKRKKHGSFLPPDPFIEQTFEEALIQQYNYQLGSMEDVIDDNLQYFSDEEDPSTPRPLSKKKSFSRLKSLSVDIPEGPPQQQKQLNAYQEAEDQFNLSSSPTETGFQGGTQLTPSLPPSIQKNIDAMYKKYHSVPQTFSPEGPNKEKDNLAVNAPTKTSSSFNDSEKMDTPVDTIKKEAVPPAQKSSWTSWIWGSSSSKVQKAVKNSKAPVVVPKSADMSKLKKSSRPTSDQLKALDLKNGPNSLRFVVTSRVMGTQDILATLYLFDEDDKIVISDVDGTITRSDGLGHVLPMFGMDWAHQGICELYSRIVKNGYKIVYLTARSIVQAAQTKQYIQGVEQRSEDNQWRLPDGPVIMSEDRLFACLHREVIQRRPEEFKIQVLKQILKLFPEEKREKVFYAGFGNRKTDAVSYKAVHVPYHHIYIISPSGKIVVYDSVGHNSYRDINAIVDQTFPDTRTHDKIQANVAYWQLDIPSVASVENLSKMPRNISFYHPNNDDEEEGELSKQDDDSESTHGDGDYMDDNDDNNDNGDDDDDDDDEENDYYENEKEEDGEFDDEDFVNISKLVNTK